MLRIPCEFDSLVKDPCQSPPTPLQARVNQSLLLRSSPIDLCFTQSDNCIDRACLGSDPTFPRDFPTGQPFSCQSVSEVWGQNNASHVASSWLYGGFSLARWGGGVPIVLSCSAVRTVLSSHWTIRHRMNSDSIHKHSESTRQRFH